MAGRNDSQADLLAVLLEHHRHYINRNWQYFGAILLIDSVVFNSYGDLQRDLNLLSAVASTATIFVAIFYHLINWTDMKIDRNAVRVNELAGIALVEGRQRLLEGLIPWMKLGVVVAAFPHFFIAGEISTWVLILEMACFGLLLYTSEYTVRRARRRRVETVAGRRSRSAVPGSSVG